MDHQVYFNVDAFVPLHHPGEAYALTKLGVKEEDALLQGRVYWQHYFVCLDCQSITTIRSVRLPDYFRAWRGRTEQLTIWSVVSVGAVALLFLKWPMYGVLLASLPVYIGFDFIITAIAKHKGRRRAEKLETDLRAEGMVHENGRLPPLRRNSTCRIPSIH